MPKLSNPGGRPRKYANDAEKQAAYRARYATISVRCEQRTKESLKMLAEYTDESEAEVVNSAIKYFLLTWDWKTKGLYGKRLPNAARDEYEAKLRTKRAAKLAGDE